MMHKTEQGHEMKHEGGVRAYLPLVVIVLLMLLVVVFQGFYLGEFDVLLGGRTFMALFFLTFGSLKLVNLREFAYIFASYDVLAMRSLAYGYIYPFIEIGLGVLYALNATPFLVNLATVVVMGVSSIGVFKALRKDRKFECACLGGVFKLPMSQVTLFEDLSMLTMALGMLLIYG